MPSEATSQEIRMALRRVRRFYDLGVKSLEGTPGRMRFDRLRQKPPRFGLSEELLRKARQFADPEQGYTREELTAILSRCEKQGFPLGTTHVIRWLTVPKRRRSRIERLTITNKWAVSRLEAEIAKEFGSRRSGGRRRQIPADSLGVLIQLETLCDEWRRWRENLVRKPEETKEKGSDHGLPLSVRRRLGGVTQEIAELHAVVAAAIKRQKPNRSVKLPVAEAR